VLLELDREMEEAGESLGARRLAVFRRIVFPNLLPAILSGVALAFARAVGEFGAVVLISGNIPFKTEVSSVYIAGQIESDNPTGAAAVSVVLLAISLGVLLLLPVGLDFWRAFQHGLHPAWEAVTNPQAQHALWLTLMIAAIAVPLNTVFGIV